MCNIKSLSFKITVGPCKLACLFLIFCHFGVIVLFYDCFVFNCCLFETQVNLGLNPQSCLYSAILGWKLPRGCIRNERVNNSISMLGFSIWIIWKTRTCCPFHQCYLLQCETLKTDERFVGKWEIQKQSGTCECVASLVQKDHSFLLPLVPPRQVICPAGRTTSKTSPGPYKTSLMGLSCKNRQRLLFINYFFKNALSTVLNRIQTRWLIHHLKEICKRKFLTDSSREIE